MTAEREHWPIIVQTEAPFVTCVCPTYNRPAQLANAIACYNAQDWPIERRELLILDDAGQYGMHANTAEGWEIISSAERFPSLPDKFNYLASLARGDVICVWEDDDVYLPHHLRAHCYALRRDRANYSKPGHVLSDYPGSVVTEEATGRFHACTAFSHDLLERIGGWPRTKRADFDQQLMRSLHQHGRETDPLKFFPASYMFRWHTGAFHGQNTMRSADDETWYDRAKQDNIPKLPPPVPQFDAFTRNLPQFAEVP